ncbi:hypothetical protein Tco_1177658, partial [Tanacetum coccineum]
MGELGGVENTRALGANGEISILLVGGVWLAIGGVMVSARVVLRVVEIGLFCWMGKDSFDEMLITFVLANFLGGFLVEEDALEAILKVIKKEVVAGFSQQWDQVCNCPPDHFLLDFEWERVIRMIMKEFMGETFPIRHYPKSSSLDERDHDMIHKVVKIRDSIRMSGVNMPIEAREEHFIGNHHYVAL